MSRTKEQADVIREALEDSFDYRGPDSNDMDGEEWGPPKDALAALDTLVARVEEVEREIDRLTLPNIARDQLPMLFAASQSRVFALEAALREIASLDSQSEDWHHDDVALQIARAAL